MEELQNSEVYLPRRNNIFLFIFIIIIFLFFFKMNFIFIR